VNEANKGRAKITISGGEVGTAEAPAPVAAPVRNFGAEIDEQQVRQIQASARVRMEAEKRILEIQREEELAAKDLTENQKLLIEEKYRQKRLELEMSMFQQMAQQVMTYAQIGLDIASSFAEAANAKDQERIDAKNAAAEEQREKEKALLNKGIIDQEEYNKRLSAIDEANRRETAKLKRRQFERQQRVEIASAIMNGAQAVLAALSTKPFFPLGLAMAAQAALQTRAQIRTIQNQKPPEFARGGRLNGPSHSAGGMPVINPRTGAKEAEVEGGEYILSKRTVANNRPLADALLHASMHRNGASIIPMWKSQPFQSFNYARMAQASTNVRRFERGGVFASESSTNTGNELSRLAGVVDQLTAQLQQPMRTYVVYKDVQDADEFEQVISSQTIMRRSA
jgi:hypothetical protein